MRTPWRLVTRHLTAHWVRSGLTIVALVFALFLFCFVTSVVTTLDKVVSAASANRLIVQSAVSLFVNLPLGYQDKIAGVPGVEAVSKMQWFGGVYQDPANFFAQFGIDHDRFFDMYAKDIRIVEGPGGTTGEAAREATIAALAGERRGAVIGTALRDDPAFGWAVGDTVPIIPTIFTKPDGSSWDFVIVGVYEPVKTNVDDRTMWFRFDYMQETLEAEGFTEDMGTGVYAVNVAAGVEPAGVIGAIDGLFENGPQRTKTTTEAAFQAIFVSMLGNVPAFMGSIGGAIVFAVLFSVVNTMLMAGRQRRTEAGILKALGFRDGVVARLLVVESLLLSLAGGGAGVLLAKGLEEPMRKALGPNMPGYTVEWTTVGLGLGVALVVGLIAGFGPAFGAARVSPVDALRSEG